MHISSYPSMIKVPLSFDFSDTWQRVRIVALASIAFYLLDALYTSLKDWHKEKVKVALPSKKLEFDEEKSNEDQKFFELELSKIKKDLENFATRIREVKKIQNEINERQAEINIRQAEINTMGTEIEASQTKINTRQAEINTLREETQAVQRMFTILQGFLEGGGLNAQR